MKTNQIILSLLFIWCIFMGITVFSIGLGAVFPSLNLIAKPFVCLRGEMQLETQEYHPSPIQTVTTLTWYCADNVTGEKVELGLFPMSLYAGTIYGLLLFLVIVAGVKILMAKLPRKAPRIDRGKMGKGKQEREPVEQIRHAKPAVENHGTKINESQNALSRIKELKEMRNANLISEAEYEQKRAEILKEM